MNDYTKQIAKIAKNVDKETDYIVSCKKAKIVVNCPKDCITEKIINKGVTAIIYGKNSIFLKGEDNIIINILGYNEIETIEASRNIIKGSYFKTDVPNLGGV